MKKIFWSSEKLMSTSAVLISLCTFIVFIYQTNLLRKEQYMSVFPYLELSNAGSYTPNYIYMLRNNGIGPAMIKAVKVTTKSGKVYDDIIFYVNDNIVPEDSIYYTHSNINPGRLLPEKDLIQIIQLKSANKEGQIKIRDLLNTDTAVIEIKYESIYGERWTITNQSDFPAKN